jgi:Agglutinin C-terminal
MDVTAPNMILGWTNNGLKIPKNIAVSDQTYFLPTLDMVTKEIFPKYWQWLASLKLTKWVHKWDCDNFAEAFHVFACGYYDQQIESNSEGIGIGIVHYKAILRAENNTTGGHAINTLILNNNNNIQVAFLEPQNGRILNLTQQEKDSMWLLYI